MILFSSAQASDLEESQFQAKGSQVRVNLGSGYFNVCLTISGPEGYNARSCADGGSVSLDLIKTGGTGSGLYSYNLTAATDEFVSVNTVMDNGRGSLDPNQIPKGVGFSGSFAAAEGVIKDVMKQGAEE